MFNKIQLIGRLAKENEFKSVGNTELCENTLALNKRQKDGSDKSIFIKIKIFGNACNVMRSYTSKGDKIGIIGELDFNSWQGKDGKSHYEHSIIVENIELLGSPKGKAEVTKAKPVAKSQKQEPDDDGEIPF